MRKTIFTFAFLLLLCGCMFGAELPGYWQEYLDGKTEEIKQNMKTAYRGDSFLFVTDSHNPGNAMHSPDIVQYLMNKTGIRTVVLGGDYMNAEPSPEKAAETIDDYISRYSFTRPVVVKGNHDTNYQGQGGYLSNAEFAKIVRRVNPDAYQGEDKLYYFYDNKKAKIRYIVLDTGDEVSVFVEKEQQNWLKKTVLSTPKDWKVLVFQHIVFSNGPVSEGDKDGPWLVGQGTTVINILDSIYDKAKAEIIGIISGHLHQDHAIYSKKGYPVIATTCDCGIHQAFYWDHKFPLRPYGTINEQVMDAVTVDITHRVIKMKRIGCGIDREFRF